MKGLCFKMRNSFRVKSKYVDDDVFIEAGRYHDGTMAIRLVLDTGQVVLVPTVCLSHLEIKPADGNVFIKDWSENEGILKGMQDAGILGEVVARHPTGFAVADECKLIIPLDDSRVRLI